MEDNRTPNRAERLPQNYTNIPRSVQPLRRARARRNLNNNENNDDGMIPQIRRFQNNGLSFAERMAQAQSRASSNNNVSVEEYPINNMATQQEAFPNIVGVDDEEEVEEEIDFSRTAVMRIKQPTTIHTNNILKVYDYGEVDEVDVNPFELDDTMLVFKAANFYFQYPKEVFVEDLRKNENLIFECKTKLQGAPYRENLHFDTPYYLLRASGNFAISYGDMLQATEMSYGAYELKKTDKHLAHTASYDSILKDYTGTGLRGRHQQVDIISADHCQAGSDRDVYELIPIKFIPKVSGGRRKQKGRGLSVSKTKKIHNSPKRNFVVHTLTGKKKNIEKQKKSMKKAKKLLGVN